MNNLSAEINRLKKKYREIFLKTNEELNLRIKEENPTNILNFLEEKVSKEIYEKWMKVLDYRQNFSCTGCATCCKLACSEFSYEELQQKASGGDNFAQQFISVFVPYKTQEEAQKIYPEYFELLKKELNGEKVFFYYCPKLTRENRCSDYENRPPICRDFPDNPLSLLPKACGYEKWKQEVESTVLMLHS